MAFLNRRIVHPAPTPLKPPVVPAHFPPAVESKLQDAGHLGKASGNLAKRVSRLFAHRKKQDIRGACLAPPADAIIPGTRVTPIVVNPPACSRWQVTSDPRSSMDSDEEDSLYDIRRPSGLGRSISSNRSMPPSPFTPIDENSAFYAPLANNYERSRAISAPNILRPFGLKSQRDRSALVSSLFPMPAPCVVLTFPNEVLLDILAFLPRRDIGHLAQTCRDFCQTARTVLYEHLDFRTLQPKQVESLVTLLAYRQDLADLVRALECHTWPEFFPPHSYAPSPHLPSFPPSPAPSFSPTLTAVFTIAFQNMNRITSLVLPSFDPTFLRHHSAFGLKKITFLPCIMSDVEKTQLFTWLDGQTNITHLALPNLMEAGIPTPPSSASHLGIPKSIPDRNSKTSDMLTVASISCTPVDTTPPYTLPELGPFNSPTLLPSLTTVSATSDIIASLIHSQQRPLDDVTLNINKTLYTGLRPASMMGDLRTLNLTRLALRFGPAVDRRTVGKVLTAGAVLFNFNSNYGACSGDPAEGPDEEQGKRGAGDEGPRLTELEVELADSTEGADQVRHDVQFFGDLHVDFALKFFLTGIVQGVERYLTSVPRPCEPATSLLA